MFAIAFVCFLRTVNANQSFTRFTLDRPVRFADLESSFSLVTEPAVIREQYLKQIRKFLELLRNGCHEFNADYRQIVTDENYEKIIADFLTERTRMASVSR